MAIVAIPLMVILDPPLADISTALLARFVRKAQKLAGVQGQVDVLITGNRRVRELNRRFRKKDKTTDVLSFPRADGDGGDIAISAAIAAGNATRYGHAAAEELKILILHGMLHLAGYDHERDNGRMAEEEKRLRAELRLPGGLIERSNGNPKTNISPRRHGGTETRRTRSNSNSQHKTGSRTSSTFRRSL